MSNKLYLSSDGTGSDRLTFEYAYGPCGNCPVQAEGKVNGFPFYLRSRGGNWSIIISLDIDSDPLLSKNTLCHSELYTGINQDEPNALCKFGAGWAAPQECVDFIEKTAKRLLERV